MEVEKKYIYLHRAHVLAILYILINVASKLLKTPDILLLFFPVAAGYLIFPKMLDSTLFRRKFYFMTLFNGSVFFYSIGMGGLRHTWFPILEYLGDVSALLIFLIFLNSFVMLISAFKVGGIKDALDYDSHYRGGHEAVRRHLLIAKIKADEKNVKKYLYLHRFHVSAIFFILIDFVHEILKTHDLTPLFALFLGNYLLLPEIFDPVFQFRRRFYLITIFSSGALTLFGFVNVWPEPMLPKIEYLGTVSTLLLFLILLNSVFLLAKVFKVRPKDLTSSKNGSKEVKSSDS